MSPKDRFKVILSVYALFVKDGRILLCRRSNTGYCDGCYGLPAGHVEAGETLRQAAAREVRAEVGILVRPEDLRLVHVLYRISGIPAPHDAQISFLLPISGREKRRMPSRTSAIMWNGFCWPLCRTTWFPKCAKPSRDFRPGRRIAKCGPRNKKYEAGLRNFLRGAEGFAPERRRSFASAHR